MHLSPFEVVHDPVEFFRHAEVWVDQPLEQGDGQNGPSIYLRHTFWNYVMVRKNQNSNLYNTISSLQTVKMSHILEFFNHLILVLEKF